MYSSKWKETIMELINMERENSKTINFQINLIRRVSESNTLQLILRNNLI